MRNAYTDGAVNSSGQAGWGLLVTGQPEYHYHGILDSEDTMVAELWAVQMVVRTTPKGTPLTVHTDAQSLPALLERGSSERKDLYNLAAKIMRIARQREITLSCQWQARGVELQQQAHALAIAGRDRGRVEIAPPHLTVHPLEGAVLKIVLLWITSRTTREIRVTWTGDITSRAALLEALSLLEKNKIVIVQTNVFLPTHQTLATQALALLSQEAEQYGTTLEFRTE